MTTTLKIVGKPTSGAAEALERHVADLYLDEDGQVVLTEDTLKYAAGLVTSIEVARLRVGNLPSGMRGALRALDAAWPDDDQ